jgi:hypothetical protein
MFAYQSAVVTVADRTAQALYKTWNENNKDTSYNKAS